MEQDGFYSFGVLQISPEPDHNRIDKVCINNDISKQQQSLYCMIDKQGRETMNEQPSRNFCYQKLILF